MNKEVKEFLLGGCIFVGAFLMFFTGLMLKQKQIECTIKHGFKNCSISNFYEGPIDE